MAKVIKWYNPNTKVPLNAQGLNGLEQGGRSDLIVYYNTLQLQYAMLTVQLGEIEVPDDYRQVNVFRQFGDGSFMGENQLVGMNEIQLNLSAGTGIKTLVYPKIELPLVSVGFVLENQSGTTLAMTGNQIWITPYGEQVVDE